MEAFAAYLLKSAVWITAFTLVYLLFLKSERYFALKRIYLTSGVLFSFLFPLITIHYKVDLPLTYDDVSIGGLFNASSGPVERTFSFSYLFAGIYLLGIIILFGKTLYYFSKLLYTINRSEVEPLGPARLIRDSKYLSSFSFFNYVFVNPSISRDEMKEIINHELVHVTQKHWFDLLLCELMLLLQWANPFIWIYTGFVRLNHEYIADELALQRSSDPAVYKAALLNQVFSAPVISLSNSFNYSITKTRFDMMKKIIQSPYRKFKLLVILPVIAGGLYAFAEPVYKTSAEGQGISQLQKNEKTIKHDTIKEIVKHEQIIKDEAGIYYMVDDEATYPGGLEGLYKDIADKLKYPEDAKSQGIQGKVILRFTVTSDGSVKNVILLRGVHPLLDDEAIRVTKTLKKFTPAKVDGVPVDCYYMLPFTFN